ncbi:MAG TPA: ABC transporter permease [Methylomirabilota bacterium]|nr:ABC transporter permease [Methylomirabilota bacterium]
MMRMLVRRLLATPMLLLGIVTLSFLLSRAVPADPLVSIIGERQLGDPEAVASARARWGLDRSIPEQYAIYVANLVRGDLGTSIRTKRPVARDLMDRLPATLELTLAAMAIGVSAGLALGVLSARFKDRAADHLARAFALIGSSVPIFWSGLILLHLASVRLGWVSGAGRLDARLSPPPEVTGFHLLDALIARDVTVLADALEHLALPAIVLGWAVVGIISRLVRASMLDVMGQDFILMARAKGASEMRVLTHHALRNALLPALTVIGFSFAYLITGAVLTETVFAWPGIGSYAVASARALDYPAIMGVTLIAGLAFILANLLTDLSYLLANPRIRAA